MRKIKILEMIDKPFLGGGQKHLLSLARSLDSARFQVAVGSAGGGPLEEAVKKEGIPHIGLPIKKRLDRETVHFLIPVLKNNRFDILHTHGGIAGIFGRWAARMARVPVIVHTLHGIHYLHYRNPAARIASIWLERFFSRFTDALIFVSDADRKQGAKHHLAPERKMHTIKNGIDPLDIVSSGMSYHDMLPLRKEFELEENSPVIGTIARLHRQKGLRFLLEAMKEVGQTSPSARLLIIGDGPQKEHLTRLTSSLSLQNSVRFLGERTQASRMLPLFDIFVLPSLWEGLPYVLMEAAAFKIPVVATRIDGVTEMISHEETGLLVPPGDSHGLSRGILRLLKDPEYAHHLGQALNQKCARLFSLEKMTRQTQDLYLRLYQKEQ